MACFRLLNFRLWDQVKVEALLRPLETSKGYLYGERDGRRLSEVVGRKMNEYLGTQKNLQYFATPEMKMPLPESYSSIINRRRLFAEQKMASGCSRMLNVGSSL